MLKIIDGVFVIAAWFMLVGGILIMKDCIKKGNYKSLGESVGMIFAGAVIVALWIANI